MFSVGSFRSLRRYHGPIRGIVLDWAGTTMDFGCLAPPAAFVESYRRHGVDITMEEARLPMGAHKRVHIRRIGLYRTKAKNLIAACRLLVEKHGGEVPRTREALEQLPGVGRKTANVILNTAFGEPTIAVDTHIFRVANRTGIAPGKNVLEVETRLLKVVPDEFKPDAHHWLILHGRYVCTARKPDCPKCPIRDLCEYKHKTA